MIDNPLTGVNAALTALHSKVALGFEPLAMVSSPAGDWYVLMVHPWGVDQGHEWVTWIIGYGGVTLDGHYHIEHFGETEADAFADLMKRAGRTA